MRRFARIAAFAVVFVLGLGLAAVFVFWLALPSWVESRLVPELARRYGVDTAGVEVRRIGLTGIDLADLRIGDALRVDSVRVDFHPFALFQGRVARVVLSGLTLRAAWDDGGLQLPGVDLSALRPPGSAAGPKGTAPPVPPPTVGRIELRHGVLVVAGSAAGYRIPFELDLLPEAADFSRLKSRLTLFPGDGELRILVQFDAPAERLDLAAVFRHADVSRWFASAPGAEGGGRVTGRADARLSLAPLRVRHLQGEATVEGLRLDCAALALCGDRDAPLRLAWRAEGPDRWQGTLSGGLRLTRPAPVAVGALEMRATLAPGEDGRPAATVDATASVEAGAPWNARIGKLQLAATAELAADGRPRGQLTLTAAQGPDTPLPLAVSGLRLELAGDRQAITARGRFTAAAGDGLLPAGWNLRPAALDVDFKGRLEELSRWRLHIAAAPVRPAVEARWKTLQASLRTPRLTGDIDGNRQTARFSGRLDAQAVEVQSGEITSKAAGVKATADGSVRLSDPSASLRGRFALDLATPRTAQDGMQAAAERFHLEGRFGPGHPVAVSGSLGLSGGRIDRADPAVTVEGIAVALPFRWPPAPSEPGTIAAARLRAAGFDLGRLAGDLRQENAGAVFSGRWEDVAFEGLSLSLEGRAGWSPGGPRLEVAAELPPWRPVAPVDLGRFAPAAAGIEVSGGFAGRATVSLAGGRPQSTGRLVLDDLRVEMPDKRARLSGVAAEIVLADLVEPRSAPGQVLRIAAAEAGAVRITGAELQFQVETARQILLEKGRFGWCGGRVFAEATRFSPGTDDYALTLFCDRLRLAEVLDQLGGLAAEGEGTVSGRIPLHYRGGRLSFDDGFLYSSPGAGGRIRVTGAERLLAGIPPETREHAQLALASEALKDYDYTWAKVGIDSEGETLALRLQFDGKPARPLPFVYRRELGRFVRVEGDLPGSNFQGIGLDVNFRLPLDRILQYGELLQMIE